MQLDRERSVERQLVFRINDNGVGPELLQQVFLERGWLEYDEEIHGENGWNVWWRTSRFRTSEYSSLLPWQWINHFPNCTLMTRKDALCRNMRKMRVVHGLQVYNFSPTAFNLPNDYTKFVSEYASLKQLSKKEGKQLMWICKPAESSRGRGIFIFSELSDLQYDCNAVVQQYIADPMLIGGYKFDLRVYVSVPSFHPLHIYIHEEGLVRFSTEKYNLDRLDNVFAHLTNTSINKYSPSYTADKDEVGHGCKWTISQLRRYFLQKNIDDFLLWHEITNIIVLTLLMQAPTAPKFSNCFELFGFDILVDSSLKPWLLEVNFSPALSSDCTADLLSKKAMLHDLMDMVQLSDEDLDLATDSCSRPGLTARTTASTNSHRSHQSLPAFLNSNRTGPRSHRVSSHGQSNRFSSRKQNASSPTSSFATTSARHQMPSVFQHTAGNQSDGSKQASPTGNNANNRFGKGRNSQNNLFQDQNGESLNTNHTTNSESDNKDNVKGQQTADSTTTSRHFGRERLAAPSHSHTSNTTDSGFTSAASNSNDSNDGTMQNPKGDGNPTTTQGNNTQSHSNTHSPLVDRTASENVNNLSRLDSHEVLNLHALAEEESDQGRGDRNDFPVNVEEKSGRENHLISPVLQHRHTKDKQRTQYKASVTGKNKKTATEFRRTSKDGAGLFRGRSRSYSFDARDATSNFKHPRNNIPRNFSRLEVSHFANHFQNQRQPHSVPGRNGVPPLGAIPKKQIGRFFLVFPFNESTQKLSIGKLDPKSIIKEMLKRTRRIVTGHVQQTSALSPNSDGSPFIWSPLKTWEHGDTST